MRVLLISRAMVAASHRGRLRELAKCGLSLTVVAPDRWENHTFEPGSEDGYEIIVARTKYGWPALGHMASHTFYYAGLSELIERENWDLVHIDDEPYNFATFRASAMCTSKSVKFVFTTWQNMMKSYPMPFSFFERKIFERAAGALPGNEEALTVLRRRGFLGPATVIPHHGVDVALFRKRDATGLRRKLGLDGTFVIGYIGRLVPEKGVQTVIQAVAQLPNECSLVCVGTGPSHRFLHEISNNLGIEKRIRWIPWVPTHEIPEYMNLLDVLVLPSLTTGVWKEQFGRVLAEAMACETCVVGSDSGEIPNVIEDAGLIFREGDERALAGSLRRLIDNPSLRKDLIRRGRERVVMHFSDRTVAQRTFEFFQTVCNRGARSFEVESCVSEISECP